MVQVRSGGISQGSSGSHCEAYGTSVSHCPRSRCLEELAWAGRNPRCQAPAHIGPDGPHCPREGIKNRNPGSGTWDIGDSGDLGRAGHASPVFLPRISLMPPAAQAPRALPASVRPPISPARPVFELCTFSLSSHPFSERLNDSSIEPAASGHGSRAASPLRSFTP